MEVRQVSNRKSIIVIVTGICFVFSTILYFVISSMENRYNTSFETINSILSVVGIFGLILLVSGCLSCHYTKEENKSLKNLRYGFDYKKELSTYIIIGSDKKKVRNGASRF